MYSKRYTNLNHFPKKQIALDLLRKAAREKRKRVYE